MIARQYRNNANEGNKACADHSAYHGRAYQGSGDSFPWGVPDTLLGQEQAVQPLPVPRERYTPPVALLAQELVVEGLAIVRHQDRYAAIRPAALLLDELQEPAQHHPAYSS